MFSQRIVSPNDLSGATSFIGLLSSIWKSYKMLGARLLFTKKRKPVKFLLPATVLIYNNLRVGVRSCFLWEMCI